MARTPYLIRRGNSWWTRIVVPPALRPLIEKNELTRALGPDRQAGMEEHYKAVAEFKAILSDAKRKHAAGAEILPYKPRPNGRATIRQIAAEFYANEIDAGDREAMARGARGEDGEIRDQFERAHMAMLSRIARGAASDEETIAIMAWAVDDLRARGQVAVEHGSDAYLKLARDLAGLQRDARLRVQEHGQGIYNGKPTHPLLTTPEPGPSDPLAHRCVSDDGKKTLMELLPKFLEQRQASGAIKREHAVSCRMFTEFLSEDMPIYRITKQVVVSYKDALLKTPAHAEKRFPGLTLPQAIEANAARHEAGRFPTLAAKTIRDKWLNRLHTILAWAERNAMIIDNPAHKVGVDVAENASVSRVPFTGADISRIFDPKHFLAEDEETRWAMLIALFAGLRPSEAAQLEVAKIHDIRGVLCFQVEGETKTPGSRRLVPVHPHLIALGIRDRLAELSIQHQPMFFPIWHSQGVQARVRAEEKAKKEGKVGTSLNQHFPKYLSKRVNVTYLPKVKVKTAFNDFYSFRHTFKTNLSLSGVEKATRDYLCGHRDSSAGSVYVHDVSVQRMKEAVDSLSFDGFDLAGLVQT
jgi:integrase